MKVIVYDMTAPVVVSYYGQTRAFTYDEMQNGAFDSWLGTVYSQYTAQPCQGVLTTITTTSSTTLATNVINTVLNLSTITSISSMGGIGNNIGSTVNTGTNVEEKKGGKNEKSNNNNPTNPNNNNPVPNPTTGSSPNSNPTGTNVGGNVSGGTNGGGEQTTPTTNPEGGTTTGETTPETGGTTTNPEQTGGSGGTVETGSNPNGGGNGGGSGTQSGKSETTPPTQDEINKTKTDQQKATSNNVVKTTAKGKNEAGKPAILLTGDIVGLQKTTDSSQDARGTLSYTRVKGDGTASLGVSADYMVNAKIGNITIMKSWIATKKDGNKSINLVSSGFSFMPGSITNTSMFIRINSLKKFTALYGVAASYGQLYREEIITGLGIAGFMYKGKIGKKVDATIILAGIYSPYTKYYTQTWFTNMPLVVPFVNVNYKMTKTFGIGLTGGTTYMAGENVINYQVLLGAKLIL
jgi:hypothetical protein